MDLNLARLRQRIPEISAAALRATTALVDVHSCAAHGPIAASAMAPAPAPDDPAWQPLHRGERWGAVPGSDPTLPLRRLPWGIPADGGSTHWLRATLRVPEAWQPALQSGAAQPLLALEWEGSGQASLEAIVYLEGAALAGIDEFHRSLVLPAAAQQGSHTVLLRCYLPFPQPFGGLYLQLRDTAIFRLGHLMHNLLAAAQVCDASDPLRHTLLTQLNNAYNLLDLREGWQSERFAASACLALEGLEAIAAQISAPSPALTPPTPTIIATGHAHLDVAWLWPLWRTRQKVAHTVATALHLMERYPNYYFSMSQPQVYAYLQQDDPDLYARLKARIAEGRCEPVGMMWLEVDCNIPSGESLVRQLLQGARFFAQEFGSTDFIVWLPDVFGYSAALPQLLRGCGISCFMTTKISWNQFNRMPYDTFRWRGIDGSEVLTHFVTATDRPLGHPSDPQSYTYVGKMTAGELVGTWRHYRQQAINPELLYIYGWGDGGGGPTEGMLEAAQVLRQLPGLPQLQLGRIDDFFRRLYARVWDDPRLPSWVGELYLEYHRGTYTSQARTKQANRAAELLYREAEWLNAWAHSLGAPNQQEQLNAGWRLILLNQFHDILPGSSVQQVYVDSNADYAEIQRIGQAVRAAALEFIVAHNAAPQASAVPAEQWLVLVNSLPWERHDYARLELPSAAAPPLLTDANGAVLPTQLVTEPTGAAALLVELALPALGYTVLNQRSAAATEAAAEPPSTTPFVVQSTRLANAELRLELDDNGEIASLYDLRYERELIMPGTTGNQLVAYEDRPLAWDAWDIDLFYAEKPYPVRDIVAWQVVETGPLRAALEITHRLGRSTIRQRICLWRTRRRIDFVTEVDWQERQMLLRALFPLNLNATRATCEIQFGAVERPTHRNTSWDLARFEVCAQRWVDLSESGYGVALLNDGKYGHSLHNSTLGLSLLKGGIFPDPEADRGWHRFTYSLYPHAGDWCAAHVVRQAYELNAPLLVYPGANTSAGQPMAAAWLHTPTEHIVVETVKVAEDGDGLIVRLYEAHNRRGPASLVFSQPIARASAVDLLERELGPVEVVDNQLHFTVRPFEVKTLRVWLAHG